MVAKYRLWAFGGDWGAVDLGQVIGFHVMMRDDGKSYAGTGYAQHRWKEGLLVAVRDMWTNVN